MPALRLLRPSPVSLAAVFVCIGSVVRVSGAEVIDCTGGLQT